jgi:hypothetical protein
LAPPALVVVQRTTSPDLVVLRNWCGFFPFCDPESSPRCQFLSVWCPTSSTLVSHSLFFLLSSESVLCVVWFGHRCQ